MSVRQKTGEYDAFGNPIWNVIGTFWCGVQDRAGNETLISSQEKRVSSAKTLFTLRANATTTAINAAMEFAWNGYTFNIISGPIFSDDRNFVTFETARDY